MFINDLPLRCDELEVATRKSYPSAENADKMVRAQNFRAGELAETKTITVAANHVSL